MATTDTPPDAQDTTGVSRDLLESEARYRLLMENISDVIWILDLETMRFRDMSSAVERVRGFTAAEVMAQDALASLTPASADYVRRIIQERMQYHPQGYPGSFVDEIEQPCKDGSMVWTEITTRFTIDPHTLRTEIYGVSRDITQRKQAEAAQRESEDWFRAISHFTHQAICLVTMDGKIIWANEQMLTLGGYTHAQLAAADSFAQFLAPESRDFVLGNFVRVVTGEPYEHQYTFTIIRANGERRICEKHMQDVRDRHGDRYLIISMLDVTEARLADTALREREQMLDSIVRTVPMGISIVRDRVFRQTNTCWCTMYGYAEDEVLGQSARIMYDSDAEYQRVGDALSAGLRAHGEVTLRTRMCRRDGEWLDVVMTAVPLDADDLDGDILVVQHDITEQVRTAEAQRAAEHFSQAVLDSLSATIAVVDADGTIVNVNRAWRMFAAENDMPPEALLIGENYFAVCETARGGWSEEAMPFLRGLHQVLAGELPDFELEYPCHSPEEQRWFFVRVTPYADAARRMAVVSHFNITERKAGEEALRESREWLDLALRSAEMGAWELDIQAGQRTFDAQVCTMLGIDPATFTGTEDEFFAIVHPDDRAQVRAAQSRANDGGAVYAVEYRVVWPDGAIRHIAARGRVLRADDGIPLRLIGIIQDVTPQKQAEAERLLLQQQLIQAQKLESIGRLAGGVAHDFNNMLAVIIGHAESALLTLADDAPHADDFRQILATAQRSADLTRQLLAFARKQVVSPVILNLNDTIAAMLAMLQRLIGENIHLLWYPGFEIWPVNIDPSQVDQILANLALNARDAITGVGTVNIATSNIICDAAMAGALGVTPGAYVRLTLRDTGTGIDPAVLPHIFDPFYTTKELGRGTGLGLATVYGIMVQNGGAIVVDSEPGAGTAFHCYLPRSADAEKAAIPAPPEAVRPATGTILIVEDEAAILRIAKSFLERLGYTVLTADRPSVALQLVREFDTAIDLLITDMIMPEMNGQELAATLSVLQPTMHRLFMSGYTADVIARQGINDAQLHFLQKPFSLTQLAATVRQILGV